MDNKLGDERLLDIDARLEQILSKLDEICKVIKENKQESEVNKINDSEFQTIFDRLSPEMKKLSPFITFYSAILVIGSIVLKIGGRPVINWMLIGGVDYVLAGFLGLIGIFLQLSFMKKFLGMKSVITAFAQFSFLMFTIGTLFLLLPNIWNIIDPSLLNQINIVLSGFGTFVISLILVKNIISEVKQVKERERVD